MYIDQLSDLLHLRLVIGSNGNGARAATETILQVSDIASGHYPIAREARGGNAAVDDLLVGKLDTALAVRPAGNPATQKLADNDQFHLVNLRRSAAYETRLPFLKRVEVGGGLLNLPRSVPERNISTLSPVATPVIDERSHPVLTPLILRAAREMMRDGSLLSRSGTFPSTEPRALRLHEDTERYHKGGLLLLQRCLPFCIASLMDRCIILLIPLIAILTPLIKPIGPLCRWRIRACIYRWCHYIRDIDCKLDSSTNTEQLRGETERLGELESRLNTVEVPLSYHRELYELCPHLNFVIKYLRGLQERQVTQAEAGNLG